MSSWSINKAPAAAQVNAAVTTAQIFPNLLTPTQAAVIPVQDSFTLDGKVFLIRASGEATSAGATTTAAVTLYVALALPSSPLVAANWTVLATSTARVVNTTSCPFWIEAEVCMSAISGKLHGAFNACVNNSFDNKSALANVLSGISVGNAGGASFYVAAGITFGVNAAAGNIGYLRELVLDA